MTKASTSVAAISAATLPSLEQLIDVKGVELPVILDDMVTATNGVYGAHIRIAAKFNELMPFDWFDMSTTEKSADAKIYKGYSDKFKAAVELTNHSNWYMVKRRVADYARNLRNGLAPNGKTTIDGQPVGGEGEGDGAAPAPRSAMLRNVEELTALWKFNDKQTELPKQVIAAQAHIEAALKALGLDVAHIAK